MRCNRCRRALAPDHEGARYCSVTCADLARAKGRAAAARQRAKRGDVLRERTRAWAAANPEKVAAGKRRWEKANPDKVRARRLAWKHANPETNREYARAWAAANVERNRGRASAWQKNNPGRVRANRDARRSRKRGGGDRYTAAEWRQAVEACGGRCFYCGAAEATTADHIVPLALGGSNAIGNIAPACPTCNSSKQATPVGDWLRRRLAAGLPVTDVARALCSVDREAP